MRIDLILSAFAGCLIGGLLSSSSKNTEDLEKDADYRCYGGHNGNRIFKGVLFVIGMFLIGLCVGHTVVCLFLGVPYVIVD